MGAAHKGQGELITMSLTTASEMPKGVLKRLQKLETRRRVQESRAQAAEARVNEVRAKVAEARVKELEVLLSEKTQGAGDVPGAH
jgi:hypothetical protein